MPIADDKKKFTIVIPDWMDSVLEGAAASLGISKSKFTYWALVNAWGAAGLGFEYGDSDDNLFLWAAESKEMMEEMEREYAIYNLDEEEQIKLMERIAKRIKEKKSKKKAK